MPLHHPATRRAQHLRTNLTDAERTIWKHLRARHLEGHKFRRQYPIPPYIVDFVCLEQRLIVEIDGNHHPDQAPYDTRRDRYLRTRGYRILRFTNRQALTETEATLTVILQALHR